MLKAVGIIRVSQPKGREGESFSSPQDQRDLIEELCREHGWELVAVYEELHVSGNALLEDRPGLSQAVTGVLTGAVDIIVGAHSERLWWSHEVRSQVLRLVGGAGGEVWAADTGRISSGTAASDFSSEVRTSADRFSRRQNAEKARAAVERAVRRGVVPFADVPPGLALDGDNRPYVVEETAAIVLDAFKLRDPLRHQGPSPIREVRVWLREQGIERSYHGVQSMLANRLYVGELHFGELTNPEVVEAIVPRDLFERVQGARVGRGRRPKSLQLLARLGVLYCRDGAQMVSGIQTQNGRRYPFYRCPTTGDCEERFTIGGAIAEGVVVDAVKARIANVQGSAAAESDAVAAAEEAEEARVAFEAAIRTFVGFEDEPATRARLAELRDDRDRKDAKAQHLADLHSAYTVTAADWDRLSLGGRRNLIRATVERAVVGPVVARDRPQDRITIQLFGE